MTDNSSIDTSVTNIWHAWRAFRRGKQPSRAIEAFEANLEMELLRLAYELNTGTYHHEGYSHKIVNEKKRRDIYVASVRDRVVHRLLYDYMQPIFNPRFDPDVWSCRPGKGLYGALARTQALSRRYASGWVYRADVRKFFDNVDQAVLCRSIARCVHDKKALWLIDEVLTSYVSPVAGGGAYRYAYW